MEQNVCSKCSRFIPHYVLGEQALFRIYCGHCTYAQPKHKKPDAKACEHFEYGSYYKHDDFASKTYLTKTLVKCILERELLPEIRDALIQCGEGIEKG